MATIDYSFKIDTNLKQQAEKVFASLGFNLDTALSIFLKQSVEKQSMPFEIKEEILNDETLEDKMVFNNQINNNLLYYWLLLLLVFIVVIVANNGFNYILIVNTVLNLVKAFQHTLII